MKTLARIILLGGNRSSMVARRAPELWCSKRPRLAAIKFAKFQTAHVEAPRLLDSRELRLFVDAVVPLSERPRLLLRKIEEPTPAAGGWCSPSSPRFSFLTI